MTLDELHALWASFPDDEQSGCNHAALAVDWAGGLAQVDGLALGAPVPVTAQCVLCGAVRTGRVSRSSAAGIVDVGVITRPGTRAAVAAKIWEERAKAAHKKRQEEAHER